MDILLNISSKLGFARILYVCMSVFKVYKATSALLLLRVGLKINTCMHFHPLVSPSRPCSRIKGCLRLDEMRVSLWTSSVPEGGFSHSDKLSRAPAQVWKGGTDMQTFHFLFFRNIKVFLTLGAQTTFKCWKVSELGSCSFDLGVFVSLWLLWYNNMDATNISCK